ncbi:MULTISPECIES: VOC family protein [unclassified Enterococcus]|uniref:lactoylglutathione lyase n=1 Tax=unclassified Enterococcus TaxID=2608891 RepID=UPI001551DB4A|nr:MULTISPECIES: VOC family protein [unclassified Enterococcus]MBS7576039.1 VOC family protein [Enterococcus sp. MMGLQ5-2]MBS7583272.1 VOC family protein [Enterococcus sp. MMGLQ5-1]NPD11132.1 lactoylglutathione lyase [Enterococcus sp. MMGLQ5-1]NPD35875.1 lactoylglutathione lyase [Enterococcus sp. MMGLQ5-2]
MKMAHTCYRVKNLEASLTFYQAAFGFSEARRRDFPEQKFTLVYLTLPNDNYELELTYNYESDGYDLGNGYGHIAIAVEDLEHQHQLHLTSGYEVTDLKGLPGTAPSYYFIKDPDGYQIEVIRAK